MERPLSGSKGKSSTSDSSPIPAFDSVTPDWVFLTSAGATPSPPPADVIGRYAYAIYDEGGLLDLNVAGYPMNPSTAPIPTQRLGRKGSVAFPI